MERQEAVWVTNPHGVTSCVPRDIGEKFVTTKIGWKYAEPEFVPKGKRYPSDVYLTEAGRSRRTAVTKAQEEQAAQKAEAVVEEKKAQLSYKELQAMAKERGVEKYWLKKIDTLRDELGML